MLKNRLIFTLLYSDGHFFLSRNFKLQKVGDLNWLKKFYGLSNLISSVDELVILNVSRGGFDHQQFLKAIEDIVQICRAPLALGGGIRSFEDAKMMIAAGADKVVINSLYHQNPGTVQKVIQYFGAQSVVGSIDFSTAEGSPIVYYEQGKERSSLHLMEAVQKMESIGVGEILVRSIDKDGTGYGLDLDSIVPLLSKTTVPLIGSGGLGKNIQMIEAFQKGLTAISTANLFNFIGTGLNRARKDLIAAGIPVAHWDF